MILLVLVLLVSSHSYELWRCPMHLYCYSMRDKLIATMLCFLYVKQTNVFQCMLFMIFVCSLSCCMHSCFVLLLELLISWSCLEFFDPTFQCLQMVWSWFWWCMSPQKLFFYHLPTRGRAGVKLGDAWYVGNVSIIFDAPFLFSIHFYLLCLHFEVFLYTFWN